MPIFQTGGMPPGYAPGLGAGQIPGFANIMNEMVKVKVNPFQKAFKALGKVKTSAWKGMKEGVTAVAVGAKMGFNAMKGGLGMLLSIADKFGALQPIMDLLGGVLEYIGGVAIQAMMPALQELADVLFSEEMIEVWTLLGTAIGEFLGFILHEVATLLKDPEIRKLLLTLVQIFTDVVKIIMIILKPIFDVLGKMSASALGALIYVVLVAMAFFKGLMEGTIYLAAAYAVLAGVVLSPLLSMQTGGITTRTTPALLHKDEAVIPLDRAGEFGIGGGETININITGGVFATDERELAKKLAKTIRLYRF